MPKLKLTKDAIRRLPAPDPSGKQVLYWDEDLKGFGVLVSGSTNVKSFVVQKEVNGRSRRVTLITMAEAEASNRQIDDIRAEAADLLSGMRKGKDPKHRAPNANMTLRQVRELHAERTNKPTAKRSYKGSIERWMPDWLDLPIREITPEMVGNRYPEIKDKVARSGNGRDPSFRSEPGAASANAAMRALRAMWYYAKDKARVPDLPENPVSTTLKGSWYKVLPRKRHVKSDFLPAFYKAVRALPSRTMRDYILLLLFTGLRREEAAGLRWSEIDFTDKVIELPWYRTKNDHPLDLPMSDFVYDLLLARRKLGKESEFVFPANSKSGHLSEPKGAFGEIGKMCGVKVSPHDLRRTFITTARRCPGISPADLKGLVNHSTERDVTGGYDQLDTSDLVGPMQIVTDRLKERCKVRQRLG